MPVNITIFPPEGTPDEITLRLRLEFEHPPENVEDDDIGPEEGPDDWDEDEYDDEYWDY